MAAEVFLLKTHRRFVSAADGYGNCEIVPQLPNRRSNAGNYELNFQRAET